MIHFLRRFKISYALYNLFQWKFLRKNIDKYKAIGLKKYYFSPLSSSDFEDKDPTLLKSKDEVILRDSYGLIKYLNQESRNSISNYDKNGFCIIRNHITESLADNINKEIDELIQMKKVKFKYGDRIMFAVNYSKEIQGVSSDSNLLILITNLLRGPACLFQSINFIMGSEQATHSDSIHMTTFPAGGLVGVWIALDDVEEDNGPLHYYPGSHKLPYYMNADYDNHGNRWLIGDKSYAEYEKMIDRKLELEGLEKQIFTARKGDMVIWHANLFHGGEPHINTLKTRRSLVLHYFNADAICYHEITQRPALIKRFT